MAIRTINLDQPSGKRSGVQSTRFYPWLFVVYTVLLIALPTGNVFGLNVKVLAFLPLFGLTLTGAIRQKANPYWMLSLLVGLPLFFSFWLFTGQAEQYEFSLAFQQYRNLLITLGGCWFISAFVASSCVRRISFIKVVLWTVAAMSVLKILIVIYCLVRGIPVSTIMNGIGDTFGIKLMSFELNEADPDAVGSRIMFTSDLLLAPCCFTAIATRGLLGLGRITVSVLILLYLVSVIFSFSRFHWAYCAIALVLGFLVAKSERIIMIFLMLGAATGAFFVPAISGIFALRFATDLVRDSDAPRRTQLHALSTFFWARTYFWSWLGNFPP